MVRKIDFVTGERLLQSFPYVVLEETWIEKIRKKTLFLAEKTHHYFRGTKADFSIRSWQKRIIKYLEEQKRLPFPLFRLAETWQEFFLRRQSISFQSARGEGFQLPLYLSEELAYLTGVIMGDGHLAEFFINIIDASKEHIENLTQQLSELFKSKTEFFKQSNANAWNVNILGKWLVRFFNFLSSQPIAARKYPALREPLIFQTNDTFRRLFWSGIMDADGSYKDTINFCTVSQGLFNDFINFLKLNGIEYRLYTNFLFGVETYAANIAGNYRKQFAVLVGSKHPQKQLELEQLLTRRVNRFSPKPQTLLKSGTWSGQVIDYQKEKLIEGYFDYTRCPNFCIGNTGNLLKKLRGSLTQKEFAEQLPIHQGMVSEYERNTTAIPISILSQIFTLSNYSLLKFYKENPKISIQASRSKCVLKTKANSNLLNLLKGIQLKELNYILFIGKPQEPLEEYKQKFCNYFSIDKPNKRMLYNAVLLTFVKEFCICKDIC